jgi:nucleoporin NUP159
MQTLGFLALGGERKVRLLPSTWPSSALPPPTASLLSIASGKGLVAAANPDTLVVASTDSIRAAFNGPSATGDVVPYEPQLKIPLPMRISQVAFSADESFLVISAEQGGGLAVYNVDALMQGITSFAFELATNAVALRALCPNPATDKAHLFALVTANGDLLVANLKDRQFMNGPNGQVLRQGVSCVSWSTRGKQLVAGMADGTVHQMTPEGEIKAEIPRPPSIIDDQLGISPYQSLRIVKLTVASVVSVLARESFVPRGAYTKGV